jgi:hypothetical protein
LAINVLKFAHLEGMFSFQILHISVKDQVDLL